MSFLNDAQVLLALDDSQLSNSVNARLRAKGTFHFAPFIFSSRMRQHQWASVWENQVGRHQHLQRLWQTYENDPDFNSSDLLLFNYGQQFRFCGVGHQSGRGFNYFLVTRTHFFFTHKRTTWKCALKDIAGVIGRKLMLTNQSLLQLR